MFPDNTKKQPNCTGQCSPFNLKRFQMAEWRGNHQALWCPNMNVATGTISSRPRAHFPVCATDFCYFITHSLKFIVLHNTPYGWSLAADSKQSPSGGRPSGRARVSYVSAVNVSLATWLLFPYRLISARGVKSPQGKDAARSEAEPRELSAPWQRRLPGCTLRVWIYWKRNNGVIGRGLKVGAFRLFMLSGGKPVRPH